CCTSRAACSATAVTSGAACVRYGRAFGSLRATDAPMLQTRNLTRRFAGLTAVNDVSLEVRPGEVFGVIGPNRAGKPPFSNILGGTFPATSGDIVCRAKPIQKLQPHRIARLGIGRTFQIVRPFSELTVLENVLAAVGVRYCANFFSALDQSRRRKHR